MGTNGLKHTGKTITLLLVGVILFCACSGDRDAAQPVDKDRLQTQRSDSLIQITTEKGRKTLRLFAMLMERYEYASEPYSEFSKGVDVVRFDSLGNMEASLVADYAIQLERQRLWEARGNVVVVNSTRDTLLTQQLFWNQRTKKIYSNVDSKILMANGDIQIGTGFESDEQFRDWVFRGSRGRFLIEMGQGGEDTGAADGQNGMAQQPTKE